VQAKDDWSLFEILAFKQFGLTFTYTMAKVTVSGWFSTRNRFSSLKSTSLPQFLLFCKHTLKVHLRLECF
jgi:hypothetical protein